jgi:ribonuclease R
MKTWNHKSDPFAKREAKKYQHPVPSREFIIDYLSQIKKPLTFKELIQAFYITEGFEKEALRRRLRAMLRDGQLTRTRAKQYNIVKESNLIFGQVIGHKDGFGFIAPEDGTSNIFLSAHQMRIVFDGDIVSARIIDVDRNNRREGQIVKVIERKLKEIVGRFFLENSMGFLKPSNIRISQDIIIAKRAQKGAKHGQMVTAKIVKPPTEHSYAIAHITNILGDYLSPGMEIEIAVRSYGLPYKWPKTVLDEIDQFKTTVSEKDRKNRKDLRALPFVTIDDESAKDFDDAIYCKKNENDGWTLYVAIADVSHYVKHNTALDQEAQNRGTSVYFPSKVIPMLPEILSNQLCSLKPNVDRLSMICEMVISAQGDISHYQFYQGVIKSHARLTYNNVAAMLLKNNKTLKSRYKTVLPHLKELLGLYYVLNQARIRRGALSFETAEFKIKFGQNQKISQIILTRPNEIHKLVEACMLCANECAAKFLLKQKIATLYRVHDSPKTDKLADLKTFLSDFDLVLGGGDLPTSADYAKLFDQIKTRPDAHIIQTVLLQSLSQAFYTPLKDIHFGLALDCYTHFTSPIRRYPDLLVHRAVHSVIEKKKMVLNRSELKMLGKHCSITERRADEATHEALSFLKCEYMLSKIGKSYTGIVSHVTGFGLFVELQDLFIEGLVHVNTLKDDYYIFEPIRHRLVGKHTDKIYRIGDVLKVKVIDVDLDNKEINLESIH